MAATTTPRKPSLLDKEDLSKSGGWTRDASGNLVPPPPAPKPEPAAKQPAAPKPPAPSKPAARGRQSRPRKAAPGPAILGPVHAPGTAGGLLLAVITYPVFIAWIRGGNPAVKAWFLAKFLNKTSSSKTTPAPNVSGTPGTPGFNPNPGQVPQPGQPFYDTNPNRDPHTGVGTGA